ncbi:MAG TPA: hypothetical protein VHF26_16095 [Trebonia sp.]|nr:hypothetical protein [Trebonia sp.]
MAVSATVTACSPARPCSPATMLADSVPASVRSVAGEVQIPACTRSGELARPAT